MKIVSRVFVCLIIFFSQIALAQIANGVYFIHVSSGLVLGAEGRTFNTNGCKIELWENYDQLNQRWEVTRTPTGTYRLKNLASNKMLDADRGNVNTNGCKVQLWDNVAGSINQEWIITATGGGKYAIRSAASAGNKVLDAKDYAIGVNGTPIQMWDYSTSNTANQIWTFLPTNTPRNGNLTYRTWQSLMQSLVVNGSYFNINNYTARAFQFDGDNTFKFRKPDDVKIRIGGNRNTEIVYNLLPFRVSAFTIYIKNLNGRIESIAAEGGRLKIVFVFESDDIELACNCIQNVSCGLTGDPNFHLNNLRCVAWAEPYAEGGQIKVRNIDSKLTGTVEHDGFNFTIAHVQPLLPFFNSTIFDILSGKIKENLNTVQTLNTFNTNLNAGLASTGFFGTSPHIYSLRLDERGNLIYVYR